MCLLCALTWSNSALAWGETTSYIYENNEERRWTSPNKSDEYTLPELHGSTLTFDVKRSPVKVIIEYCNDYPIVAQYYSNDKWNDLYSASMSNKNTWYTITCTNLPTDVTRIRFCSKTGATGYRHVRNVKVTRATTLSVSSTSPALSFGNVHRGNNKTINAKVDWNNTTYNQQLTGSGPAGYSVTATTMGEYGTGKAIPVKFTASSSTSLGAHNGNITLTMNGKTVTIPATANVVTTYYGRALATASTGGSAYVSFTSYDDATTESATTSTANTSNASESKTAYYKAVPSANYEFVGWTLGSDGNYKSTSAKYGPSVTYSSEASGSPTDTRYKAWFKPIFNFEFTANAINGSYGTANVTYSAKVLGDVGASSASTQPTFTATPGEDCEFEGWYYDEEHTNLASSSSTYRPNIENQSIGSTTRLTLYAWFRKNQTLTWANAYEKNIIVGDSVIGAATVTSSSGRPVTYTSSNNAIATVSTNGDVKGKAVSNDDVTITASLDGNNEYRPATSISRDFHIISKYQAEFVVSGFSGTSPTINVGCSPTITVSNVSAEFTYASSDPTVVAIERSGNVLTLTALKAGSSTVTLHQPETRTHSEVSASYSISVTKMTNTLAVSLAGQAAQVDGTIGVSFTGQNNTGTPIVANITNQVFSSSVNNGTDVITYSNGTITARNAGTAKITFIQEATNTYEGFTSSTYDITVTKLSNPITITLAGGSATNIKLKYGNTATLSYTSANNSPTSPTPTVTRVSGSYTTLSGNTITAGNAPGTDFYEIRQAETYKYEAGYASFSIWVNNTDEEVGYVYTGWTEGNDFSWYSGGGPDPLPLSGPGKVLTFDARHQLAGSNHFYVMYSTDNGQSWYELAHPDLTTDFVNYPYPLPDDVTHVKLETRGGTLQTWVKNIYVTRKTYLEATSDKTDLGIVYTGSSQSATFTVKYSSTNGGNIHINSSNLSFTPSVTELSAPNNSDGTRTFTVTYTPDPNNLGPKSATIKIEDLFRSQQITLTATAAKHDNTLAVIGEQNLKVDDEVTNVYSGKNSNAALNWNLSRSGVITYDEETNTMRAVGEGDATLTFTQLANDFYHGATKSVTVHVTKYSQTLSWNVDLDAAARTLNAGETLTTNTATASSGLDVTYSSSNASALEVDPTTGKLTAKAGGSNIAITATQAGNYKYSEAVSITRYFTVISKLDATVTTSLAEAETNIFPIGSPAITIGCSASLTEDALTVTGDDGIISVAFADNTFTLTALADGTVTVTLTRAEDDGYNALSKTYSIQVIKPALALNPAAAPLIDYEEYSSVTLNRTLKAGYSTIALPFDTDVSELVAGRNEAYDSSADWVAQLSAVTSSVADGYTLYFQKVAGGVIRANEPYVLHLGYQVVNPSWTDLDDGISVEEAEADSLAPSAGYSGYTGWAMWSNFTPSFAMSGKYGIVNSEGGLKLGGNGSTLNAFMAYIAGPSLPNHAPRLRVAYVDEDGTATFIDGLPEDDGVQEETVAVYGPDGQRRNRMQRGVNIVRFADGTTRKVQY